MSIKVSEGFVLYDVDALSKLLDIQPRTIRLLFREGKLKGKKVARKWYTTEAELKAFFGQPDNLAQKPKEEPTSGQE